MFCEECGNKNSSNSMFCTQCGKNLGVIGEGKITEEQIHEYPVGTQDTSNENPESSKKSKKKGIVILSFTIVLLLIGILGSIFLYVEKNTEEKRITAFSEEIKGYENIFEDYILDDELENYQRLLESSKEIIAGSRTSEIEDFLRRISGFDKEVSEKNANDLNQILAEFQKEDVSRANDEELKSIDALILEIKEFIDQKKFVDAKQRIDQLEEIIELVTVELDNLDIIVDQVDTSEYPKIKLYLNIKDRLTSQVPTELYQQFFYLSEKLSKDSEYIKKEIIKVMQLNQNESLNINMVADVSGSMIGYPMETAKYVMSNFLETIQFGIGDKVELTAFSDGVYTLTDFTTDKQAIRNQIEYLDMGNMTSLYDALFAAVNKTAVQNGAKCVIAFTDGRDNNSACTPQDVLNAANRYRIPIFIVGIGNDIDTGVLDMITTNTNGFYVNVNDVNDLEGIYNKIYRQQKELYMLEYEITEPTQTLDARDIIIDIQTREFGGQSSHTYEPNILMSAAKELVGATDVDDVVGKYLNGFVKAINSNNYSYLEDYVVEGGPLYKEVEPYIQKNIREKLLSYEVVNKVYQDDVTCAITVHETYEIQNFEEPLHMRLLEAQYVLKKQANGAWKFYAFNARTKILSKINS